MAAHLYFLPFRRVLVRLQLGEAVAVGNCIQLLAGLAHGTLGGIVGDVAGEILGSKQSVDGDAVNGLSGGEHGSNSLNRALCQREHEDRVRAKPQHQEDREYHQGTC